MIRENIGIIVVIIGTIFMALSVDTESFLHDGMKKLFKELKNEGVMTPAKNALRKWPYWGGLFLIGLGTALRWNF